MPTQDPKKAKTEKQSPKGEKPQLSEEELKTVSGGLRPSPGMTVTDPPCITSLG